MAWVERMDWTPTPEQVEIVLNDSNYGVRMAWLKRMDWTPTPEQIESGLNASSSDVRDAWMERLKKGLEYELVDDEMDLGVSL